MISKHRQGVASAVFVLTLKEKHARFVSTLGTVDHEYQKTDKDEIFHKQMRPKIATSVMNAIIPVHRNLIWAQLQMPTASQLPVGVHALRAGANLFEPFRPDTHKA